MSNPAVLSLRGTANVAAILPRIKAAVSERTRRDNPNIDLSTAENWLIRPELREICKSAIANDFELKHMSYPNGFSGDHDLLDAFAGFFNAYFNPCLPVEPSHLATAPGASSCLDALLYNICNPGDGVLVPGPYWNGFDFQFQVRSTVTPVVVNTPNFGATFTMALIPALEAAFDNSTCPIKALVLTNPHNPFGCCYSKDVLEACLKFCQHRDIHFISDEVYALTSFDNPEIPEPVLFVSALALDVVALGCDMSRVHVIWSTSKDFGSSGIRMGCTVTQGNQELAVGLALASNTQTSSLAAIFTTALLKSPTLSELIALNSTRLYKAYMMITSFLNRHQIEYIPMNAGLYVFAKLARMAKSWEDEAAIIQQLKGAGVLVSGGKAYHGIENEKGWVRITFSVQPIQLEEALRRIESILGIETGST